LRRSSAGIEKRGTNWTQQAYLKASNTGEGGPVIRCTGAPEVTYQLQRAASITGSWETIASRTIPLFRLDRIPGHDATCGAIFYRMMHP